MPGAANDVPGENWPAIYVQARCHDCGVLVFSEAYREVTAENYEAIAAYWQRGMDHHRRECVGTNLHSHRELAALVRLMIRAGRIGVQEAQHLLPILNGIRE